MILAMDLYGSCLVYDLHIPQSCEDRDAKLLLLEGRQIGLGLIVALRRPAIERP